jgi:4-carboxymuconolactone decarboxylase
MKLQSGELMTRIKILDRSDMDAEQGRVYDAAAAKKSPLGGPYYAYIRLPKLFEAAQALREGQASGPLSRREQVIVQLSIARSMDARYPWFAQARAALGAGFDQAVVDAVNARETPVLSDPRERTCFMVARELVEQKRLGEDSYAAALKSMGENDLVALVAHVGSFVMTCLTANAFAVDPPADNPTPLKA